MTLEEYEASIAAKRAALKKAPAPAAAKSTEFAGLTAFKRVDVEAEVSELTALEKEKRERAAKEAKKGREVLVPAFRVGGGDAPRGEAGGGRGGGRGGRGGDRDRDGGGRGGGRGRGEGGRGGGRGEGGRGGGRGGGSSAPRAPRTSSGPAPPINDSSAFPTLGA
jgi:hypothetical protein